MDVVDYMLSELVEILDFDSLVFKYCSSTSYSSSSESIFATRQFLVKQKFHCYKPGLNPIFSQTIQFFIKQRSFSLKQDIFTQANLKRFHLYS